MVVHDMVTRSPLPLQSTTQADIKAAFILPIARS